MKASEIRAKSAEERALALTDLSKQVVQLRIQAATERLQTVGEIREARKDIARIKTIQREIELKAEIAALEKAETEARLAKQKLYTSAVERRKELIKLNEEGKKKAKEKAKEKAKAKAEKPAAKGKAAKQDKGGKTDKAGSGKGKGK